jgi:hypothetical protein
MFDVGGPSRRVTGTVCRRPRRPRPTTDVVGEDAAEDVDDVDIVVVVLAVWPLVVEVLLLLVLGGAAGAGAGAGAGAAGGSEPAMPKGVSSSFILEEDATFLVAGRTRDCAAARALSLRW